ncbi:MAG: prepilin-type N-terminal cleavage/methylation domain-containing protein [Aquificaceae bacterium]|nr:prepilin-type N-terminal cleavage/methylation domain-containing protein [Aquificaceae bacterium]MCX8076313.1 prepilin-type N-terminal cleavage/methylation domain-containing protein [Aquificaceae bacterium]MDW8434057.1 prepilin-type N-terminal cleavage/methylation domain-containing protein [Aquificaceae bacterium]
MYGSRGFTLLELMVAIVVLAVGFSVISDVISNTRLEYSNAEGLKSDLVELNNRLVEGKVEGLQQQKKTLEDYPQVEEVVYRLGSAELVLYQLKR